MNRLDRLSLFSPRNVASHIVMKARATNGYESDTALRRLLDDRTSKLLDRLYESDKLVPFDRLLEIVIRVQTVRFHGVFARR